MKLWNSLRLEVLLLWPLFFSHGSFQPQHYVLGQDDHGVSLSWSQLEWILEGLVDAQKFSSPFDSAWCGDSGIWGGDFDLMWIPISPTPCFYHHIYIILNCTYDNTHANIMLCTSYICYRHRKSSWPQPTSTSCFIRQWWQRQPGDGWYGGLSMVRDLRLCCPWIADDICIDISILSPPPWRRTY